MNKKFLVVMMIAVLSVFMLCACAKDDKTGDQGQNQDVAAMPAIAKEDIKVGFVYVGPIGDEGYTFAHNQGRLKLEKELGVKTMYKESVAENADCEKAIRDLIDQGCNVIYATSFGFMDWTANVAKEFPNVYFGHATGYLTANNMSNYMGRVYEPRYLSGIAAGMKTTSNKIGYVAAMPIPEVIRGINAFTLGVRSVNPKATVEVVWTNTWVDAALEKSAAMELLNKGCDVIAQHSDTTGPQIAAQEKGAFAVGYNAPTYNAAPDAYLTAPMFDWGAYYVQDVQNIIDGKWKSQSYYKGLSEGIVLLDELSPNCAEGTKEAVEAAKSKILSGDLYVFAGPLKDNQGNEKVAQGKAMTDEEILSFNWFVEGVIGTVPESK